MALFPVSKSKRGNGYTTSEESDICCICLDDFERGLAPALPPMQAAYPPPPPPPQWDAAGHGGVHGAATPAGPSRKRARSSDVAWTASARSPSNRAILSCSALNAARTARLEVVFSEAAGEVGPLRPIFGVL